MTKRGFRFDFFLPGTILFCVLLAGVPLWAGNVLNDPRIPHGEKLVYRVRIGDRTNQIRETVSVRSENGRSSYEFRSESDEADLSVSVDNQAMTVIQSRVTRKSESATVENTTRILRNEIRTGPSEIALLDFISLPYILRGFPFGKPGSYRIRTPQSGNFNMEITRVGESVLTVGRDQVRCDRLELVLSGFWGMFVPKTQMWYASSPPHYLVRYEGLSAGPGSPPRVMELVEYSVKP